MTFLFRRAAICAGLAACGFSAPAQAQDSIVAPERAVLRRSLPVAAAPIVQQSPNGLYKLSITDTGIEIGAPTTTRVRVMAGSMDVRSSQDVRLEAGSFMVIRAGSNLDLRSAAVQVRGDGGASLIGPVVKLGCPTGKAVARAGDQVNTAVILQGSPTATQRPAMARPLSSPGPPNSRRAQS